MNKLTFSVNATWLSAILLSTLSMHSMENHSQLTLQETACNSFDCPLPNFKLEDELVFTCCQVQEVPLKKSLQESKKAFQDAMKNLIKMRITCKKYYQVLTFEKIGGFCKKHSNFAKNQTFCDLMQSKRYLVPLTNKQYHLCRIPITITIHALDDKKNDYFSKINRSLFEQAIDQNDSCVLKALLKYKMIDQKIKIGRDRLDLSIFRAKTIEIAQILMDNDVDIHASYSSGYNILSKLLRSHVKYSERKKETETFYLEDGSKVTHTMIEINHEEYLCPTKQATWDLIHFYLNHNVIMSDEDRKLFDIFTNQYTDKENATHDNSEKYESSQ